MEHTRTFARLPPRTAIIAALLFGILDSAALGQAETRGDFELELPFDSRDVVYCNPNEGWAVGRYQSIVRTVDGGETWSLDESAAALDRRPLNALALDGTATVAVAVGQHETHQVLPTILFNLNLAGSSLWQPVEARQIDFVAEVSVIATEFRDVDWVSGQEFWAVGREGLVVYSDPTTGVDQWRQFVPSNETYSAFSDFDIDGVSFATGGHGVLVGSRIVNSKLTGKAYHAERTATGINWTEIPIPNESSLRALTDVDFDGTTAYATGIRDVVGGVQGVVLKATLSAGVFSDFIAVGQTFSECAIGDAATAVPVLTEVEIAPGGAIWVGGQCGKLWKSTDGGANWNSVRSQTDAHVRGMSFPAADTGFIACHRQNRSGHCVIRIVP